MVDCQSQPDFSFASDIIVENKEEIEQDVAKKQDIDFGHTEVGTKKWLKINIENEHEFENMYLVTKNQNTNPLFQVFGVDCYKFQVPPSGSMILKVFYKPLYPNINDLDLFDIIDQRGQVERINVYGTSDGPVLHASATFVQFTTWNESRKCKKVVQISNASSVAAHYDVDATSYPFSIDQQGGTIPGKKTVYIQVVFEPKDYGTYTQELNCLVLHHQPIIIQLYGCYSSKKRNTDINPLQYKRQNFVHNYQKYMNDVQTCLLENPLFSLSEIYMNFGGSKMNTNSSNKSLVTSMTNHDSLPITVVWEKDDCFKITPAKIDIPPNDSALFECTFCPDKEEYLFSKTLLGNVFWIPKILAADLVVAVPLTTEIRTLGNSFAESSWMPQLEIVPEVIIPPPALPNLPSYLTFYLKTSGHLPVSFQFVPPKKTNFIVKPMIGIVNGKKLIVIQLQSDSRQQAKVYIEQWSMVLNGRPQRCSPFYVKGFSEPVSVIVGNPHGTVKFTSLQRGCIGNVDVPLMNTSQHSLEYKFLLPTDSPIDIDEPNGSLNPKEEKLLKWTYKSSEDALVQLTITLTLYVTQNFLVIGDPVEIPIEVIAECSSSELSCSPNSNNLGKILCHSKNNSCFQLFNYGLATIHFRLVARSKKKNKDEMFMDFFPKAGTVLPKEHVKIAYELEPKTVGDNKIDIYYLVRLNANEHQILQDYEKHIHTITYHCFYPCVQIVDIAYHNFGPLFTKIALWEIFDIDRVNRAMKDIKANETDSIQIVVPDSEMSQDIYYVVFVLKNVTDFEAKLVLQRKKNCACECTEYNASISIRKKKYSCPHRQVLKLISSEDSMQPNSLMVLQLFVKYSIEGFSMLSYNMLLSHDRCICMNFHVRSLPDTYSIVSRYNNDLVCRFKPVSLSEKDPSLQTFWLYNNTERETDYELSDTSLSKFSRGQKCQILVCLNSRGKIGAYSSVPLLFKFMPIELNTIHTSFPLRLGDEYAHLHVVAEARKTFTTYVTPVMDTPAILHLDIPIALSQYQIFINPFPLWSTTTRMIFVRNAMRSSIIGYSWQSVKIDNVVHAKVLHRKGVLRPDESHCIIIQITSFQHPCKIRLQLPCKLLDHTQYYVHKRSVAAYNARQEALSGQFTMTENGTYFPVNDVVIQPFPDLFYAAVALEINISSIADRDLHYTPHEQLSHSPSCLGVKNNSDLNQSVEDMEPVKNDSQKKVLLLKKTDGVRNMGSIENSNSQEIDTEQSVSMYRNIIECIIGDVVFSNLFREILAMKQASPQIYYSQLRKSPGEQTDRKQIIADLCKEPQPRFIANVLNEIITDSVHSMFKLGPQIKNRPAKNYSSDIKRMASHECGDTICNCHV